MINAAHNLATCHDALAIMDCVSYRLPLQVTESRTYRNGNTYPICPRCKMCMDREYMSFCDRCGQCLAWNEYSYGKQTEDIQEAQE